ncbi:hypothetical protein LTR56_004663 [Elasticomyces elasticus]|nr:hypothetical protein LTR22_019904 [Elasticomyces elasticus]KAK3653459.1 hypothetical protein LTR56_004663 [Elasticomyces elasticus]KAK4926003.1 hypothetical protein LTR49_007141 [Elasticomyces elasticus]KAK5768239.1 hypothetical protein LTS12_001723 [Elasticomyces elasticus]
MPHNSALQAARSDCASPRPLTKLAMASTAPKLLTMPPEMRNRIYELVFGTQPGEGDLTGPAPPSRRLLLTCAQVYHEARGVYQTACTSYWAKTHFTIRMPLNAGTEPMAITEGELSAVRHLQLTCTLKQYLYFFAGHSEYLKHRGTGLDFQVRFKRRANGRWVCTTAYDLILAGSERPRVVLADGHETARLDEENVEDHAAVQSYSHEAQSSAHRRAIGKEELEVLLARNVELGEGEDDEWW